MNWTPEFLNRMRAGFSDEEWYGAWYETWDEQGGSGRILLDAEQEGVPVPPDEKEYSCGYNTVSGAFHKPGCTGECGVMNFSDAVKQRRIQRRKAKG